MDKSKLLRKYANEDEKTFAALILDYINDAQNGKDIRFTDFLDMRQREIVNELIAYLKFNNVSFNGGYDGAERMISAFYPEYFEESDIVFPIRIISLSYIRNEKLSHRDILGALLGLGIKRQVIGDILKIENGFVVFIQNRMMDFIIAEFKKAGKSNIKTEEILKFDESKIIKDFKEIKDTVASPRLDCIVSSVCGCGRAAAADLIKAGKVSVNGSIKYEVTFDVTQGNILSVKGYGRFVLEQIGPVTKKGRLFIIAKKFL